MSRPARLSSGRRRPSARIEAPGSRTPPHDQRHPEDDTANHAEERGTGYEDGDAEPDQPQQHRGDHAGPEEEPFLVSRFVGWGASLWHVKSLYANAGTTVPVDGVWKGAWMVLYLVTWVGQQT